MDLINELSDELLIKILSFLPTKVAVSTSILSKRWECLWMWLTKLKFDSVRFTVSKSKSLRRFLNINLPLHRSPVIQSFDLKLDSSLFKSQDIRLWLLIAVSRYVRELNISYIGYPENANILPSSLYNCKSLVTLRLCGDIRLAVPRMVSFPSLKTLRLRENEYLNGESLRRLLSICPILEDLLVNCNGDGESGVNMGMITIIVPTLQRLYLDIPYHGSLDGLVIDTPCLKYLKLEDDSEHDHSLLIENMPKLEEAYVYVRFPDVNLRIPDIKRLIGSITSVKRLTLCVEAVYGEGFVFNQLRHLRLCMCTECRENPLNLLVRLLEDSPNLKVLEIFDMGHGSISCDDRVAIDETLMSSLKNFNWSRYLGRPQKKDLKVYILGERLSLQDSKIKIL